jgi:hypothetical protein
MLRLLDMAREESARSTDCDYLERSSRHSAGGSMRRTATPHSGVEGGLRHSGLSEDDAAGYLQMTPRSATPMALAEFNLSTRKLRESSADANNYDSVLNVIADGLLKVCMLIRVAFFSELNGCGYMQHDPFHFHIA